MAARLVFVVFPAMEACCPLKPDGSRATNNHNMRTSQTYGSWTEDSHAMITVGNSFTIPKEDLFDHPESVGGGDLQKFCETGPSQGLYCFSSIEEVLLKYGNIVDRAPPAKELDGSKHIVVSSRQIAKLTEAVMCHGVGGMFACHVTDVDLHEVVTQVSDGSSRTLRVACHTTLEMKKACHAMFPGDVTVALKAASATATMIIPPAGVVCAMNQACAGQKDNMEIDFWLIDKISGRKGQTISSIPCGQKKCTTAGIVQEAKVARVVIEVVPKSAGLGSSGGITTETHEVEYHKSGGTVTFTVHSQKEMTLTFTEGDLELVDDNFTVV